MSAHPLLSARVAAEVRAEKARQKLSGRELALRAGFPTSTVARWLRDETLMNLDEASALAGALGLSLTELLTRANDTVVVASARELPIRRRRSRADVLHEPGPERGRSVTNTYRNACDRFVPSGRRPVVATHVPSRVARIGGGRPDLWRMGDMPGSHEYPILLLRHARNLGTCQRVAA